MPDPEASGPASAVVVGDRLFLVDAGAGVTRRLAAAGFPRVHDVAATFITHLHSDHTLGYPDLIFTTWIMGRRAPLAVYGPPGLRAMTDGILQAWKADIDVRVKGLERESREWLAVDVHEIGPGVVYDRDGVKVTAFEVDHGDLIKPAFGFRVDYGGRSVTISGDTRFNENLIKHATGTTLLIHQVAAVHEELLKNPTYQVILAHHTKPEEAGVVFSRTKPKLAVYYHFVLLGTPQVPPLTERDVLDMTRKTYDGPIVTGEDLMSFVLRADGVDMKPAPGGRP